MDDWRYNYTKVIVCGDRNGREQSCGEIIKEFISRLRDDCMVIHGGCRGVDMIADNYARKRGLSVNIFPAEWGKYGKAAGPIRNKKMLADKPDLVVAFHPDLAKNRGSKNMVNQADKANVQIMLVKI